jgi:hypothetical protein
MNYKEAYEILQKVGFTSSEIDELYRLHRDYEDYTLKEMYRTRAEQRRLEFARWLVQNGKLSEQAA